MVDLSDLFGAEEVTTIGPTHEFMIYHKHYCSVQNGGCCCYWYVPYNTQMIKFEIVGGGGPGGSSGGSHDWGIGGQGGAYGAKSLYLDQGHFVSCNESATSNSAYTLCAAGTSNCSCCCMCNANCRHGCKSYVTGTSLSNFCANGGMGGSTSFDVLSSCYSCMMNTLQHTTRNSFNGPWHNWICDSNYQTNGADICFTGTSGGGKMSYGCCQETWSWAGGPTGPFAISSITAVFPDTCMGASSCCASNSNFPGGGGTANSTATSTGCWGTWGAGGLVKVTYQ